MTVTLRDGTVVEDPRLDRIPFHDPASRRFQIRELLEDRRTTTAPKWWIPGPTLDQQREGQCVSEACHDARNGTPDRQKPAITLFEDRRGAYHEMQHDDPWRGCFLGGACPIEPDAANAYGGTAVLAGAKHGQRKGWWREYRWIGAGSQMLEDDVIETLGSVGGIVFGIPWLEGMYSTSASGLVQVEGREVGGHAIHGWEWSPRQRMPKHWSGTKPGVWWHNSWGPSYGVKRRGVTGSAFILLDDLLGLLERPGSEGMVPLA